VYFCLPSLTSFIDITSRTLGSCCRSACHDEVVVPAYSLLLCRCRTFSIEPVWEPSCFASREKGGDRDRGGGSP
jgi:hypothetical protein